MQGNIDQALKALQQTYPALLKQADERGIWLLFICRCQQFIELIARGRIEDALEFLRGHLTPFSHNHQQLCGPKLQVSFFYSKMHSKAINKNAMF